MLCNVLRRPYRRTCLHVCAHVSPSRGQVTAPVGGPRQRLAQVLDVDGFDLRLARIPMLSATCFLPLWLLLFLVLFAHIPPSPFPAPIPNKVLVWIHYSGKIGGRPVLVRSQAGDRRASRYNMLYYTKYNKGATISRSCPGHHFVVDRPTGPSQPSITTDRTRTCLLCPHIHGSTDLCFDIFRYRGFSLGTRARPLRRGGGGPGGWLWASLARRQHARALITTHNHSTRRIERGWLEAQPGRAEGPSAPPSALPTWHSDAAALRDLHTRELSEEPLTEFPQLQANVAGLSCYIASGHRSSWVCEWNNGFSVPSITRRAG